MTDWRSVPVPTLSITWGELRDQFVRFASRIPIPSKEQGIVLLRLLSSQEYLLDAIFQGLAEGYHDFVIVKARQLGASVLLWALDLFWMMKFGGMQGLYIADSDPNKEIHRDQLGQMLAGIPPRLKRRVRVSNRLQLAFDNAPGYRGSRLMFSAANLRNEGQLGRSRGVNYIHGEELQDWTDESALEALEPARAATYPLRLYTWVGTGMGYGLLHEMWEQAEDSTSSRQVFLGYWMLDTNVLTREQYPENFDLRWSIYGEPPRTQDEDEWAQEVERRFGHVMQHVEIAWWRMMKAEGKGINGEEAKALEQYPWLPEQAFQASGSQFISATTALRLRTSLSRAPSPQGYRYDWGSTFDERGDEALVSVPVEAATLKVWDEPLSTGLYIVAGDPAYGSSEKADSFAATVWRAHPDQLVQVAQYQSQVGTMYQFAWILAHLASNYPRWLIYDVNGPGMAVLQELKRLSEGGLGLTRKRGKLKDVIGSIQGYLWARPDILSPTYARQWKTGPSTQEPLMEQLRDTVERGALVVRDPGLVSEISALRRKAGRIEPGGIAHDDLAVTAAMAVEYWLTNVMDEVEAEVAPRQSGGQVAPAETRLLRTFLRRINTEEAEEAAPKYGIRTRGPGR